MQTRRFFLAAPRRPAFVRVLARTVSLAFFFRLALALATALSTAAAAFAGGDIYTSSATGTVENFFPTSPDAYLSGGLDIWEPPSDLPDGTYYFQVTDLTGEILLSSDPASCRQLVVYGGFVAGASPASGACAHADGIFDPGMGGTVPVQLFPFARAPNAGKGRGRFWEKNEYEVWLIRQTANTTVSSSNPEVLIFRERDAQTSIFSVENALPPPPPASISSCRPSNSLTVLVRGADVTAYVPNGNWLFGQTGIQVVPIEPTGTSTPIATQNVVNSCASNWTTGETVCAANNTDVYLITGTTLNTTLTSGADSTSGFSGGSCENCGVAINAVTNTAVITMGLSPTGNGLQFLNLATNTLAVPVRIVNEESEDIVWDPARNLILSPDEDGTYDLFNTTSTTPPSEFANSFGYYVGQFDSAGEDCTTGIALATDEYTNNLFLTDLTQAVFTPGSPAGTWTAPWVLQTIPEFAPYTSTEAGTDGIAVAPGSHLGIVTGEFPTPPSAGNAIIAIELPSTSGSGTPSLVDYAVATLPNDPGGNPFSMGCDPHTTTAYVSPNTGKAIGLVLDYGATPCYSGGAPAYVGVIDLQGLLSAPRVTGTHTAISPLPAGVVTFVSAQ
jgi:hypothetical protein